MPSEISSNTQSGLKSGLKRFAPILVIAAALTLFFALGGPQYFNIESLRENREMLTAFVDQNLILALLGFIAVYASLVAISFPGASILSVFGGFMFGTFIAALGIVFGATIGATIIFLAARYAIGDTLSAKAGPYMQKFEKGLHENELSYLFILRLIPLFPFFIVNIVPALFQVRLRNYVLATFFGIIPGALVYAGVGAGIGSVFDRGEDVALSGLMTDPKILGPIIGLILLSLLPVIYKKYTQKKAAR